MLFETKKKYNLNSEINVKALMGDMKAGININLKQENYEEIDYSELNNIKPTHTKSNLGREFIFWFICNVCVGCVRCLYSPSNSTVLACRNCHKLSYEKQN